MRCPICDAETLRSLDEELRQQVKTRPTEGIQGQGKETGRKTQFTALEGALLALVSGTSF